MYKGRFDLKYKKHRYLCRYCQKPLPNHEALRSHTYRHIVNKEICLVGENIGDLNFDVSAEGLKEENLEGEEGDKSFEK